MEVSYKRDMNHTYMICRGEHPVDTSAYPVRMMLSNQWKAFLPCRIQGMDNQIFFYYDITSRQSLSSFSGTGKLATNVVTMAERTACQAFEPVSIAGFHVVVKFSIFDIRNVMFLQHP